MSARLAPLDDAAPRAVAGPRRLVLLFLVIPLFNYLGAKISLTPPNSLTGITGFDPVNMAIQAFVLAMGAGYTLLHPRRVVTLAVAAFPFVLLFGVAGASVLWSQSPEHSLRRTVGITAQVLFVFILYAELGLRRAMKLVLGVVLLTVVMGLMEAVLRPSFGFDTGFYSNAIRGVYPQKNTFGTALIHGSLALSFLMLTDDRLRRWHLMVALVLLVMLVLARSATALVLTLTVLGLTGAWLAARAGGLWLAALLLGSGLVAAGGLAFTGALGVEGFYALLGKDETLTGRTEIWASVDRAIADRPWLGHGFAAFWIQGLAPAELIWLDLQWETPDAHSGWREVVLQIGWVGFAALAGTALLTLGMALWRLAGPRRALGYWVLILMVVAIIHGNTESAMFRGDALLILWMLGWLGLVAWRGEGELERPG